MLITSCLDVTENAAVMNFLVFLCMSTENIKNIIMESNNTKKKF